MTTPVNTTPETAFDPDSVFDNAGGGGTGAPSFAWPSELLPGNKISPIIGGSIKGEVTDIFVTVVKDAKTREPKLNKRGVQMPQVNVTLQTTFRNWEGAKSVPTDEQGVPLPASEDTGLRRIYVKFKMLDAIAKAIQASAQGKGAPRKGAVLAVRVTGLEDVGQMNPLVDYEAAYQPPAEDPSFGAFDAPAQQQTAPAAAAPAPSSDPWAQAAPAAGGWGTGEPAF